MGWTRAARICTPCLTAPETVQQAYAFYTEDVRRVLLLHTERRDPPMEANVRTSFKASPVQSASPAWRADAPCITSFEQHLVSDSALVGMKSKTSRDAQEPSQRRHAILARMKLLAVSSLQTMRRDTRSVPLCAPVCFVDMDKGAYMPSAGASSGYHEIYLKLSDAVRWQVAALAEFRKDWQTALRSYDAAYRQLQSVPGGGQFPVQRYFETLACAELLHFKVCCRPYCNLADENAAQLLCQLAHTIMHACSRY